MVIPRQVPIPDAKLAASVYRIDLYHRFTRASLGSAHDGEGCSMLESKPTCGLIANLPKCLSLVVHKFCTADEERCEKGYGWVSAKP